MANWVRFRSWMFFRYLDENVGLSGSYTVCYRFTDDSTEQWTARFNKFKAKDENAVENVANVFEKIVPPLVHALNLDASKTCFIPALSSGETNASPRGVLSRIAHRCASATGAAFVRDAITKKAHRPIHDIYAADARGRVLDGANYTATKIDTKNVLVVDDMITRGGTLSRTAQAIQRSNPGVNVYGLAFAKAERQQYHRDRFGIEISNEHVPAYLNALWR